MDKLEVYVTITSIQMDPVGFRCVLNLEENESVEELAKKIVDRFVTDGTLKKVKLVIGDK